MFAHGVQLSLRDEMEFVVQDCVYAGVLRTALFGVDAGKNHRLCGGAVRAPDRSQQASRLASRLRYGKIEGMTVTAFTFQFHAWLEELSQASTSSRNKLVIIGDVK